MKGVNLGFTCVDKDGNAKKHYFGTNAFNSLAKSQAAHESGGPGHESQPKLVQVKHPTVYTSSAGTIFCSRVVFFSLYLGLGPNINATPPC